jgi:hypothetical protein
MAKLIDTDDVAVIMAEVQRILPQVRDLVVNKGLYSKVGLRIRTTGMTVPMPADIEYHCAVCGKDRHFATSGSRPFPFARPSVSLRRGDHSTGREQNLLTLKRELHFYKCSACEYQLTFFMELDHYYGFIRKIGQAPPFAISAPRDIKEYLGNEDTDRYEKAMLCMSVNQGLGACAYFRRILENQINPMLELQLEIARGEGASAEELAKIEEAIQSKAFDKKASLIQGLVPKDVMSAGLNPIKTVYDLYSEGLHGKTEEECTDIAVQLQQVFIFLARRLSDEYQQQRDFTRRMREIYAARSKRPDLGS